MIDARFHLNSIYVFINIRLKSKFNWFASNLLEDVLSWTDTYVSPLVDGLSNPDLSPEGEGRVHLFLSFRQSLFIDHPLLGILPFD